MELKRADNENRIVIKWLKIGLIFVSCVLVVVLLIWVYVRFCHYDDYFDPPHGGGWGDMVRGLEREAKANGGVQHEEPSLQLEDREIEEETQIVITGGGITLEMQPLDVREEDDSSDRQCPSPSFIEQCSRDFETL